MGATLSDPSDLPARLERALGEHFRLERELGGGGMARVFVARETALGRHVVIKVLAPEVAHELSAERFAREVRLLARLQQANIVPRLGAGTLDGLPYYTMPYVRGESLRARLAGGAPLPVAEALGVLRDVLRALAYAHAEGVVHRDVKPENVLLSGGTAVVTDFGVARAMDASRAADARGDAGGDATLTRVGTQVGTPAYMAPEQAAGEPDVDHRADLYAWGVLAYELLAGRHPFAGKRSAQALIAAHLIEAPAPLGERAAVPPALGDLVMRCLAKEPADRPPDAGAVLAALEAALAPPAAAAPPAPALPRTVAPSVAVLPFANLSSDPENEYLSDGLTDEIIGTLGRRRALRVAGRASCFALKGQALDPRAVGERLGVAAVVEGSVRRAGNRVRVHAELVNATDGYQLWGERFDRELTDIFAVQEEIAGAIADALQQRLAGEAGAHAARSPSGSDAPRAAVDPAAYDLYLRGRFLFEQHVPMEAMACFERAVARDPSFAPAHCWISFATVLAANLYHVPATVAFPRARAAADRALALQPDLGEALVTRGFAAVWFDWDLPRASALAAEAVSTSPSLRWAHELQAWVHLVSERFDHAVASMERAYAIDPLSDFMLFLLGLTHVMAGRPGEGIGALRRGLARTPGGAPLHYALGLALLAEGRSDEAVAAFERLGELSPTNTQVPALLAGALAASGRREEARRMLAEAVARIDRGQGSSLDVAGAHLLLGERDAALRWLERAFDARDMQMTMLHLQPRFRALHGDPDFEALVRRVGLAPGR